MLSALTRNLYLLAKSTSPVDPSSFLRALQNLLCTTQQDFNYNTQQDASDILNHVLEQIKLSSMPSQQFFLTKLDVSVTCNSCKQSSPTVEIFNILTLPVSASVQLSLEKLQENEQLTGDDKWF